MVEYLEQGLLNISDKIIEKDQYYDSFLNPDRGTLINLRIVTELTNSFTDTKNNIFAKFVN